MLTHYTLPLLYIYILSHTLTTQKAWPEELTVAVTGDTTLAQDSLQMPYGTPVTDLLLGNSDGLKRVMETLLNEGVMERPVELRKHQHTS
jgi:hypothetical protein